VFLLHYVSDKKKRCTDEPGKMGKGKGKDRLRTLRPPGTQETSPKKTPGNGPRRRGQKKMGRGGGKKANVWGTTPSKDPENTTKGDGKGTGSERGKSEKKKTGHTPPTRFGSRHR